MRNCPKGNQRNPNETDIFQLVLVEKSGATGKRCEPGGSHLFLLLYGVRPK